MTLYNDSYLMHYGVLGMKWGVRHDRDEDRLRSYKVTTKHGETFTIDEDKKSLIARGLAMLSGSNAQFQRLSGIYTMHDAKGNKIGDLQTFDESETSRNIVWIGVNTKSRGKGYASAAMKQVINQARKDGKKKLTLEVPGDSPDARHIYESLGFKATHVLTSDDDVWGGLTAMEMDLTKD